MSTKTLFDAKADLAKMDLHGKEVYAGKNLIAHYGCFACHAIPGFEDAKPIGTELTEEGSKAVHRLDFGFIHLPHTRQDWFWTEAPHARASSTATARAAGKRSSGCRTSGSRTASSTRWSRPCSASSS